MSDRDQLYPLDRRAWLLAIGRRLRVEYDAIAEPVPPRLAALVNQLETPAQGSGEEISRPEPPSRSAGALLHPAEDIGSALKGGVNVCQRQLVNEVFGPLVTKFVRNFGREGATPIQRGSQAIKFIRHNTSRIFRAAHIESWVAYCAHQVQSFDLDQKLCRGLQRANFWMNKTQNAGGATKGCSALSLPTDVAEREGLNSTFVPLCFNLPRPSMAGASFRRWQR
jgi:hypothetical protein